MSEWKMTGDGDISVVSSRNAGSRIALLFLRPGQVATIMSAIGSVTVQLSHGSGMAIRPPGTQPKGHIALRTAPSKSTQLRGHITPVIPAQPHPVLHILGPMGLAAAAAGAPGGSKGGCEAQDGFVKQRVEVSTVVVTVVLVTKKSLPRLEKDCHFLVISCLVNCKSTFDLRSKNQL